MLDLKIRDNAPAFVADYESAVLPSCEGLIQAIRQLEPMLQPLERLELAYRLTRQAQLSYELVGQANVLVGEDLDRALRLVKKAVETDQSVDALVDFGLTDVDPETGVGYTAAKDIAFALATSNMDKHLWVLCNRLLDEIDAGIYTKPHQSFLADNLKSCLPLKREAGNGMEI